MNQENGKMDLQDRVYTFIRDYIVSPNTPPGVRLYEQELCDKIGVSRTPVRIALKRLELEGLVKIKPNHGATKVHLRWREVVDVLKIRETLECLALEMAKGEFDVSEVEKLARLIPDKEEPEKVNSFLKYAQMDQLFHDSLVLLSNSHWVLRAIKSQDQIINTLRVLIFNYPERVKLAMEEHAEIVNALKNGNIDQAIANTRKNWRSAVETLEKRMKTIPGFFL